MQAPTGQQQIEYLCGQISELVSPQPVPKSWGSSVANSYVSRGSSVAPQSPLRISDYGVDRWSSQPHSSRAATPPDRLSVEESVFAAIEEHPQGSGLPSHSIDIASDGDSGGEIDSRPEHSDQLGGSDSVQFIVSPCCRIFNQQKLPVPGRSNLAPIPGSNRVVVASEAQSAVPSREAPKPPASARRSIR